MNRSIPSLLHVALAALAIAALPACTSEESSPVEPTPEQPGNTGADIFTCVDDDLSMVGEFRGPGYDPDNGGLLEPVQESYLASTTLIAVKPESQGRFFQLMMPFFAQLPEQEGLIGYQLAQSDKCGYGRTVTVWRDEEAMMAFVMSDNHVAAMSEAPGISSAAVVTSWEITAAEVPLSWDVAREKAAATEISYGAPAE
jgi:heme-degrading monooxygenase HmoA